MGSLEDQSSVSSAGASQKQRTTVVRKESVETQEYVSCQDMEVDSDESLGEFLRMKCMRDKIWNEEGCMYI